MLLDGSHAIFRAYFAIRSMSSPSGAPTNAVFGFTGALLRLLERWRPDYTAICFDTAGGTFRDAIDPAYKANRPPMPEDLRTQWPIVVRLCRELGLPVLEQVGIEADDIIATLACRGREAGMDVLIVSGDKDLMQLVIDGDGERGAVRQLDERNNIVFDPPAVAEKWGVAPVQVADLLAIMGDAVDNIAGIRGIGRKGAAKLLNEHGTIAGVYAAIEQIASERTRRLLEEGRDAVALAQRLVALVTDADLPIAVTDLAPQPADREALTATFTELGFQRLLARFADQP